jgi:hypothetical protein
MADPLPSARPEPAAVAGGLCGSDPVPLARRIGEAARAALLAAIRAGPLEADADAAYLAALRARTNAAMQVERWDRSRRFLCVHLDLQPEDATAGLDLGRGLVRLRDPGAVALLQTLLARETDPARRLRLAHQRAICRLMAGDAHAAEAELAPLLALAEHSRDRDAELELLVSMAETAAEQGSDRVAEWMLHRAERLARTLGDDSVVVRVLATRWAHRGRPRQRRRRWPGVRRRLATGP